MPGLYRKVSCAYWQGELAEALRGDAVAHTVAFYLMTCPSTNQIGCYRLALATIADDVGYASETCLEAVSKLSEMRFCTFDERFRMVFVREFARHEWGESPNAKRNEVVGLRNSLPLLMSVCPKSFVWNDFWDRYGEPWAEILEGIERPDGTRLERVEDASRTRLGRMPNQDQDQEGDQDPYQEVPPNPPPGGEPPRRRSKKVPRQIEPKALAKLVEIPEELQVIGIDYESLADRVLKCSKMKLADQWQGELDRLAPLVADVGAAVVLEVWDDAVTAGWQGCTPAMVRERSARGPLRDRKRQAQPPLSEVSYDPADYGAPTIDVPARLQSIAAHLPESFAAFRPRITASANGDFEKTEAELVKLDRELLKAAAEGLDDETRAALAAEVDAALAKLGDRLDDQERKKTRRRFKERALRERLGLPELSLFGKEAQP